MEIERERQREIEKEWLRETMKITMRKLFFRAPFNCIAFSLSIFMANQVFLFFYHGNAYGVSHYNFYFNFL